MGGRNSKRSVDISGGTKEGDDAQPLDGKLEKLEEGAKMAANGASHSEHNVPEKLEEPVSNGDPVNLPEAAVEEAGPSSPSEDLQVESPASETVQPAKKKEKVKKKWSLRSLSFSKKDKSKPVKEESAKEDTEGVPEVTDEKAKEGGAGFLSSVTEAVSSRAEAVGEALVAAEHKVEEGLTATQDQVEKISAKVAEKAEALVSKMEAMTVQAVDTAQEALGIGHPHETTTEQKTEESTVTVTESTKSCKEALDTAQSKVTESLVTNVIVADPATIDSGLTTTITSITTECSSGSSVVLETIKTEVMTLVQKEVPPVKEVETRTEEIPPPLPASPPPTSTINEVVASVVNNAISLAETKESMESENSISKNLSPIAAQAPTTITEAIPPEITGGGGDGEELKEACEPRSPVSMPTAIPSSDSLIGEVVNNVVTQVMTEVIDISEQLVVATDHANEIEENGENEVDDEDAEDKEDDKASPEIVKKPSETSETVKGANEPPPEKSAEE